MKNNKLTNQITVNLDQEAAQMVQYLAEYYQRKPAELVRLLLVPTLREHTAKAATLDTHTEPARLFINH